MKYLRLVLAVFCTFMCTVCSCATGVGDTAALILGNNSVPPMFLSCKAVSETEINFRFSQPVSVVSLRFSPAVRLDSVENGSIVRVNYSEGPGPGEKLTADLLAEDENGNTINVLVPFRTRNNRIPKMFINELRTEYSKPKCEFIEFKVMEAGNLGALRVFVAGNYKEPLLYEFPPIEAGRGEYITLHLRTIEEDCRDELGSNLDESGGTESSPTARDLWIPGAVKLLRKTDIVYILDQDDNVVDAVILSENADPWWNRDYFAEAAEFLFSSGAWQSPDGKICSPADAVRSTGTTNTRTICRDETLNERSGTAADWYITATSCATPGKPNNPKRYN